MGAVLHTLNIRLFEDDLRYIVGHARGQGDLPRRLARRRRCRASRASSTRCSCPTPTATRDGALDYEQLVADGDEGFEFPDVDERSAAALCYTSGTTGKPKGVLYSHRSTVLHAIGANQSDGARDQPDTTRSCRSSRCSTSTPGACRTSRRTAGARLVMPGPRMTPGDLAELIASEQVTFTAGVPTIWQGMMRLDPTPDLSSLKEIVCGGSAVPESLIRGFEEQVRRPDRPGVGHDRDEPARVGRAPRRPTRPTTRTSASGCARRRAASSRSSTSRSTRSPAASCSSAARGSRAPTTRTTRRRRSSRTAGCAPATSRRSPTARSSSSSTARRTS